MDIEERCKNCDNSSDCFYIEDLSADCDGGFQPREDVVELHRLLEEKQWKLRRALDAIELHKATATYYGGLSEALEVDKELWKILEELR